MQNEILIVDDNPENLRVLGKLLEKAGYGVRAAKNGVQAITSIEAEQPDLVLLDVHMPDVSGFDVCKSIREDPLHENLPVIFLTALDDSGNKVLGFAAGANDYITKPFDADEVLARVATHLTLRRTQDQLARSYKQLKQLETMRTNLVHMIIHDLKSPLFALNTSLEFLKEDLEHIVDDDSKENLNNVVATGLELAQMVDELLDINKLEEGRMPLRREDCDLTSIVSAAVDSVKGMSRDRIIEMNMQAPSPVVCDLHLIRRVVENLVSNALIHTPPGKPLTISLTNGTDEVRFAVKDRGPGVPAGLQERIFEKFETAKARKEGQYHSSGLGLAYCKLAVEAHNGEIGVESVKGKGATFWFTLPNVAAGTTAGNA